jgi:hypothetical protein
VTGSCLDSKQHQQQRRQSDAGVALHSPLPVARVKSAARVPLPDATPRGFRDAPPSRLPKTPRSSRTPTAQWTAGSATLQGTTADVAVKGSLQHDVDARQTPDRHHKARLQAQSALGMKHHAGGIVPALQLSGLLAADHAGSSGLAAGGPTAPSSSAGHQQPTSSPLSARLSSTAVSRTPRGSWGLASARAAPMSSRTGCTWAGPRQILSNVSETAAGVQAAALKSPGVLGLLGAGSSRPASSNGSLSARSSTIAAAVPKQSEQERSEQARQQLRLLKVQCMQYRHLNARVQAALQIKKQKVGICRMGVRCSHRNHFRLHMRGCLFQLSQCMRLW